MKSIRLSLVIYFLLLLGLALGAVSGVVYWSTAEAVAARKKASANLLRTQYDRRAADEKAKFDDALLAQARALASGANFQFQSLRGPTVSLMPLGALSGALTPNAHAVLPLWLAEGVRGPLSYRIYRLHRISATEIQFNEDELPALPDGPSIEYLQINSEWGNVWRSRSLGEHGFPVDAALFATNLPLAPKFDDFELSPGVKVRRVLFVAHASRFRVARHDRPEFLLRPSTPERGDALTPTLLVQVAADPSRLAERLAEMRKAHNRELAALDEETHETLATLRYRLLGIGLAAFLLTVVGGFWLVRLGLSPLQRLSFAVSQVSEKDFRLPFDQAHLPNELSPIVERLEQTLDQLRRAFAREKQAAADISHELRTPLAALMTTIEVALRKTRTPDEYRDSLADCHTIGQQMSQLVERLLALARLDAGVDTLRPRVVDAAALAEQCAALVRPLATARNLNLTVHGRGAASLVTDPDKLREVLTNLLHNAIEYNRPEGTVDVTVERKNGSLHMEVRDTGIGITEEAQAHIFERFYRADPSRQATGLHAGLGLAIVKGYVDLMGGRITLDSSEGRGTTFCVDLPAEEDKVTR